MSYLCYIYIITYRERTKVNREGKSKGTDRQGRKRTRAAPRAVCHPTRLVLFPVSLPLPHVVRIGQSKRASSRRGRGRTKAKDAADISPVPRLSFCSVCCPHRPHHRQPFTTSPPSHQQSGRGKGAHHVRLWVMPSIPHRHHLATDRPATRRAAPRSVCHPARLVLFPVLFPSIRW